MKAKPFIKWAGGKTQLLKDILPLLPESIETYYEPFIGGAAVFFALANEGRFKRAVINDYNPELTNLYTVVRDSPDTLIDALDQKMAEPDWNTRERFNALRPMDTTKMTAIERAVRFLVLNKTGFNGMWRVNRKGIFNVPWGGYAKPMLYSEDTLLACSKALQGVEIRTGGFRQAVADIAAGDVVYFDPPYVPVSKTANFTAYSSPFGPEQQADLAKLFRELQARGVRCLLSNSSAPLVRELYQGLDVREIQARRSINSDPTKRGAVTELLILGSGQDGQLLVALSPTTRVWMSREEYEIFGKSVGEH